MSLASSAFGFSCLWRPGSLRHRASVQSDSKVIIRTRSGAFVVVNGSQDLLRELYFVTEECIYIINSAMARMVGGAAGSVLLAAGVVLLGNSSMVMQIAIGIFYTVLNVMYWTLATLPTRFAWDLSRHQLDQCSSTLYGSYPQALWQAMLLTQSSGWVGASDAVPLSGVWSTWIREAERNLGNPTWNYGAAAAQSLANIC